MRPLFTCTCFDAAIALSYCVHAFAVTIFQITRFLRPKKSEKKRTLKKKAKKKSHSFPRLFYRDKNVTSKMHTFFLVHFHSSCLNWNNFHSFDFRFFSSQPILIVSILSYISSNNELCSSKKTSRQKIRHQQWTASSFGSVFIIIFDRINNIFSFVEFVLRWFCAWNFLLKIF